MVDKLVLVAMDMFVVLLPGVCTLAQHAVLQEVFLIFMADHDCRSIAVMHDNSFTVQADVRIMVLANSMCTYCSKHTGGSLTSHVAR